MRASLTSDQPAPAGAQSPTTQNARWLQAQPDSDIVLKLAFIIGAIEILMVTSRSLEILASDFGLYIPYLGATIYAAALGMSLVSGRIPALLTTRSGMFIMAFTAWLLLITPMSQWRGGTVHMLVYDWLPSIIAFLSCSVIVTLRQCRQIAKVLSFGVLFVATAGFLFSTLKEGRLAMEEGTLGNANDLSMLLLLSAPFLLVPFFTRGAGGGSKLLAALAGLGVLAVTVRAGSRSGLLALVTMVAVLFLLIPFAAKLKLALASVLLAGILLAVAPSNILNRYATTFSDPTTIEDLHTEAFGSKIVRQQLFKESVAMTLENPIFGVGPGMFIEAEAVNADKQGRRAKWKLSHNSYTQVSSETGLPGFIIYIGGIWTALANVWWMRKNSSKDPSGWTLALSLALLLSVVGTAMNFIFSSSAYSVYMPTLIGLSAAFRMAAQREFALQAVPVQPAAAPVSRPSQGLISKALPALADTVHAPNHRYRFLGRARRLSN